MSVQNPFPKNSIFSTLLPNPEGFTDITVEELSMKKEGVNLVDVRRPDEWIGELGHISGSKFATLETDLMKFLDSVPAAKKEETWIFVCRSGARSGRAAAVATQKGFGRAYNMMGGMIRWNAVGLPVQKELTKK
jgi:rhodanese-related sulfurtransferase